MEGGGLRNSGGGIGEGQKQWQVGPWPRFLQPRIVVREYSLAAKESSKLAKVRRRGYFIMGDVNSLTRYSSVPQGEDTRMDFNGNSSGLNTLLWDPHFVLPTVRSNICAV